jgi:antirestriction protein ArdC
MITTILNGVKFQKRARLSGYVAEIGSAFLCADLSITDGEPRADHAQYLAQWLKLLKDDSRAIFTAAAKASEAVAYLRKLQPPS